MRGGDPSLPYTGLGSSLLPEGGDGRPRAKVTGDGAKGATGYHSVTVGTYVGAYLLEELIDDPLDSLSRHIHVHETEDILTLKEATTKLLDRRSLTSSHHQMNGRHR